MLRDPIPSTEDRSAKEPINLIYDGRPEDFLWVGFGSGSGTNLRECSKVCPPGLIFSDKPKADLFSLEDLADVPKESINGLDFCGSWKKAQGNPDAEAEYKRKSQDYNIAILELLQRYEDDLGKPFDLIVLGGYMRFVGDALLDTYKDKIINVHPADLNVLNPEKDRKFVGENAVYDAIKARQIKTRSSVIMVDGGVDHGEILVQGPEVSVWAEYLKASPEERESMLPKYAKLHQDRQKTASDWPAFTLALELIRDGRLALGTEKYWLDEWRAVYLDEKQLDYAGHRL